MKTPKVTVLMSVYNGKKYLHESVGSILNQTFKDFEFVIINDGSTDGTEKILEEYSRIDKRIVLIHNKENLGLTKSLNKGIKVARGEYIARMDMDDISASDRLKKEVEFLDHHQDYAVIGTFVKIMNKDSNLIYMLERPIEDKKIREMVYRQG